MYEIKTNKIFEVLEQDYPIICLQGGTRSGKTYQVLIHEIVRALQNTGEVYSITRSTLPALKRSVLRDFKAILTDMNLWSDAKFNKTELQYELNGNLFEFFSLDNEHKVRGSKRNRLFVNEATDVDYDSWVQLALRTTGQKIIDYNPAMQQDHWIIKELHSRKDCFVHKSTYKDNPFLEEAIIREIETLKKDPYLWKVYGLGEIAPPEEIIYRYDLVDEPKGDLISYGMDFGVVNPTTIIALYLDNEDLYLKEVFYKTEAGIEEIIDIVRDLERVPIIADKELRTIDEINKHLGNRVQPANKGGVSEGIRKVKRYNLKVVKGSDNLIFEFNNYRNMKVNGEVIEKPLKKHDHAMDAIRYGLEALDIPEVKVHDIWD